MRVEMKKLTYNLIIISILIAGCKTISTLPLIGGKDQVDLKKLKRGTLNSDRYINDYYEFELVTPRGWNGHVSDPPTMLTCNPSRREFRDSQARKLINISIHVRQTRADETLDQAIADFAKTKGLELLFKSKGYVKNADSCICTLAGNRSEGPIKLNVLFVLRNDYLIQVECSALRPLFENVESNFKRTMSSFINKAKPFEKVQPTAVPSEFSPKLDYFDYNVLEGDTGTYLAKKFLGNENRAWFLIKYNELEDLKPGMIIKIPRFIPYTIQSGDTYESTSKSILGKLKFANWLKIYNKGIEWAEGNTINIPLYELIETGPREGYFDVAERIFHKPEMAEYLLLYNGNQSLNLQQDVRIPIFLIDNYIKYKVQTGDSLAFIAKWLTGDSSNYKVIADVNKISRPYTLTLGQELKIPSELVPDPSVINRRPSLPDPPKAATKSRPKRRKARASAKPTPTPKPTPVPSDAKGFYEPI